MFRHCFVSGVTLLILVTGSATACAQDGKLVLQQGKMIEVGFLKVKAGSESRLSQEYFSKVMPIAQEYGMRPLMTFRATKVEHGAAERIGLWGMFEWPSVAKKAAFEKDPRFEKLRDFRDSLLVEAPKLLYTRVAETVTVQLTPDADYEAAVIWVNAHRGEELKKYFAAAGPFIEREGVKFIGQFEVIGHPENPAYRFDALPSRFAFIEWPSVAVKAKWFASEAFAAAGHHRALAVDRLVVVESKANLAN